MSEPKCACADPGVGSECHCALLRDFPGGFYGDLEQGDYMNEPTLWCECWCHEPDRDDYDDRYDQEDAQP